MRKRFLIISGAISLCALTIDAQQPSTPDGVEFKPDQSVYVVAVKTYGLPDPQMLRLLSQASKEKGRRRRMADKRLMEVPLPPDNRPMWDRPEPERVILERSISAHDTLTSTDLALKRKLEEEFKRRKKFKLAASAETADIVFFAISRYASRTCQIRDQSITCAGIFGEAAGDYLIELVAYAIPSSTYRLTKKDFTVLGQVAQWEGAEVSEQSVDASAGRRSHSATGASVKDLVERFHQDALKKKKPEDALVQARSSQSSPNSSPPTGPEKKRPATSEPERDPARKSASDVSQYAATIRIETSLVVVPVSVLDRDGKYIPDLVRSDFHIYEDDVEQEIDRFSAVEAPFHVVLLIDISDSARLRIWDIQNAALAFVEQLRLQDRAMVAPFDSRIYVNSEFTGDRNQLRHAIYSLRTGWGTRLYDAIDLALSERLKQIQGRKAIVIFTDGVDTESRISDPTRTLELVEESSALVYTVQYDTAPDLEKGAITVGPPENRIYISNASIPDQDAYDYASRYLAALTERAGGRLYRSEKLSNLNQSLSLIAEDLRQQYAISYYPTNTARDGSYRRIRVTVSRPNVAARARAGYRAARR